MQVIVNKTNICACCCGGSSAPEQELFSIFRLDVLLVARALHADAANAVFAVLAGRAIGAVDAIRAVLELRARCENEHPTSSC